MNNTLEDKKVSLTAADGSTQWVLVSDGIKADVKGVSVTADNTVTVPRKSLVVAVPKNTFDANPVNTKTNTVPNIVGVKDMEVEQGTKVEFTITGKDSDEGDTVTLSASDLPAGATFDAKTGIFSWASATAGNHTIKFTVTDSTNRTKTVKMKLRVTSPTLLLKEKVEAIDAAALTENDYTKTSWNNLQTAMTEAKALIADTNASDVKADELYLKVSVAYQVVNKEKRSRAKLTNYISTATEKIAASSTDDFDVALVADAKAVKAEAEELLKTVGSYEAYDAARENLQDACDSLISNLPMPCVYVKTDIANPNLYVWNDNGAMTEGWPGVPLTEKNADGYYVFELPVNEAYNAIVNSSEGQTIDIKGLQANTYLTIGNGFSIDEQKEEAITGDKKVIPVTKKSLEKVIATAKIKTSEEYAAEGLTALAAQVVSAEAIVADTTASQLTVNKQARAVRAAMVALVRVKSEALETPTPVPPTPVPTEVPATATPSAIVTATPVPTATVDPNLELTITDLKVSPVKYQLVNKTITATVSTIGGKGSNQCRFYVYDSKGILVSSSKYSEATSYSYKALKAGTYTIKVVARDAQNNEVEKFQKITVISKKVTVSSLKASKNSVKKGKSIQFTATVSGGKSAYHYQFVVKDAKGKTVKTSSKSTRNNWTWKTTKTGTYRVTVTVQDALGMKATKTITKIKVQK